MRRGIRRAFLDVSGDCLALDAPPGEAGWRVDVADPERPGAVIGSTRLRHAALATSSNLVSVVRYGRAMRGPRHGSRDRMAGAALPAGDGGGSDRHRGGRALDGDAGLAEGVGVVRRSWVV